MVQDGVWTYRTNDGGLCVKPSVQDVSQNRSRPMTWFQVWFWVTIISAALVGFAMWRAPEEPDWHRDATRRLDEEES